MPGFMRSPSARCLVNRVDISAAVESQDADGGVVYTYPAVTIAGEPCSVQPQPVMEVVDEQQRVTQVNTYRVMFGRPTGLPARARIDYVDPYGTPHVLFYHSEADEAGRGAAFTVTATEKA